MVTDSLIPLFPLPVCVLPGEILPLYIFEERYKLMISRCLEWQKLGPEQGLFGVHFADHGKLAEVGCAVSIEKVVQRYADGRFDILTVGQKRYRVRKVHRKEPYQEVEAEFFDDFVIPLEPSLKEQAVALHCRLLEVVGKQFSVPMFPESSLPSFILAHESGMETKERQRLLEMTEENARLRALVQYYRRVIPEALKDAELKERIHANGYFRHLKSIEI